MDKNILLGIIVIIFIICIYNNIYDQFGSINENYKNIVQSKYANNMKEKSLYEKILNSTVKTIKLIPKINHDVKLSEYKIYNNTNNLIVSMLCKKKDNKENNKEPSIFESFYNRVISLKPLTLNSKSLIENASSDPSSAGSSATGSSATGSVTDITKLRQDENVGSQLSGINIFFYILCFVISIGVIYLIIQNGDKLFKLLGINVINKTIELRHTDTSLIDELRSSRTVGGNNMYYTGGYDINLYSE